MPSKPQATPPSLVVGIGASAGGLAAFKTFLANTPADTGMAFILVQHLDPHHKSLLVELLGASAAIPVMEAAHGMAVRKNCVFVIPPDATLTIKDRILSVIHHARPAVGETWPASQDTALRRCSLGKVSQNRRAGCPAGLSFVFRGGPQSCTRALSHPTFEANDAESEVSGGLLDAR